MDLNEQLLKHKIVAIFRGFDPDQATLAADALISGGIRFIEVTMNTADAEKTIRQWKDRYGEDAYIGAGTVIDLSYAKRAVEAGARFLISPNFDREVIEYGKQTGTEVWPGVTTPTEIVQAWKAGAQVVKLFPLASLGIDYLKEIKAPLESIPMMATGGVTLDNMERYLQAGADALGIGSGLLNKRWIEAGMKDELKNNAARFVEMIENYERNR